MIKFADCRSKNTAVGCITIIIISIKREIAAMENRIPDNINRIISWKSLINTCIKNVLHHSFLKQFDSLQFSIIKSMQISLLIYTNNMKT